MNCDHGVSLSQHCHNCNMMADSNARYMGNRDQHASENFDNVHLHVGSNGVRCEQCGFPDWDNIHHPVLVRLRKAEVDLSDLRACNGTQRIKIAELQRKYDEAMRGLESLTPSGSEFVGDVKRCVAFVKDSQHSQHQVIVKFKLAKDQAEAELTERTVQRDAWINYAFVGAVVPREAPADRKPTVIEELQRQLRDYTTAIAEEHTRISTESGLHWEYVASPQDVRNIGSMYREASDPQTCTHDVPLAQHCQNCNMMADSNARYMRKGRS